MKSAVICTFRRVLQWRGAEDETSAHIPCECETLSSNRHVCLGSFFLEPEGSEKYKFGGPTGTLAKQQGYHDLVWGTMGLSSKV